MKQLCNVIFLILIISKSFGQFTLEHTYNSTVFDRIILPFSGEKYYMLNGSTKTLELYNSNHTLWKTIPNLIVPNVSWQLKTVSQNVFNSDSLLEIACLSGNLNVAKVISEDGTILFTDSNIYDFDVSEVNGNVKLMIKSGPGIIPPPFTKVYSSNGFILEHTYPSDNVVRTSLTYDGEKYYYIDTTLMTCNLYNSNHTFWKTINLNLPAGYTFLRVDHLSQSLIDPDSAIEIIFSAYQVYSDLFILSETQGILKHIPEAQVPKIDTTNGLPAILTVYHYVTPIGYDIYDLPTLNLNAYHVSISRVLLTNYGEKFFGGDVDTLKIYNSDHSPYRDIPYSAAWTGYNNSILTISDNEYNSDTLIEMLVLHGNSNIAVTEVISESGNSLLTMSGVTLFKSSKLPGTQKKFIARDVYFNHVSMVYGLVTGIEELDTDFLLNIYPNPAKDEVNISIKNNLSKSYSLKVYDVSGKIILKKQISTDSKINFSDLSKGLYIVEVGNNVDTYTRKKLVKW